MSGRTYLHQVLVAAVILRKQDEVIVTSMVGILEIVVVMSRHIYLTADDRLDLRILLRHLQKLLDSVHVAMVGDCQSRHAQLFCAFEKASYRSLAVEDGILCMDVKMDK